MEKEKRLQDYRYAMAITSQFYFCGIPFRFDTSPKCKLNCAYCFAMAIGGRKTAPLQFANIERIRRKIENSLEGKALDISGELLNRKMPIHFGGMSDPFADEETTKISVEILRLFAKYDYPVVISTKNTSMVNRDEVFYELSSLKNLIIQISFSSIQEKVSILIEPFSPLPKDRLKVIRDITSIGIPVYARIQPFLPWKSKEVCDELIPALKDYAVNHIIVEILKLPVERSGNPIGTLSNLLDFNISEYFLKYGAINMSREYLLPTKLKWDLLQPVINSIHNNGLTYGAADYGLTHLGDTNCCCGLDKLSGFSNYFKSNFSYFIRNSKSKFLFFGDFSQNEFPSSSIKMYLMSHSRLEGNNSVFELLKSKWNHPNTTNSLDSFFGVHFNNEYDEFGNCVYEYGE